MLESYFAIKIHAMIIAAVICIVNIICLAVTHYKRWKRIKNALKTEKLQVTGK